MSANVNPFASLVITYGVSLIIATIFYFLSYNGNIFVELKKANIASALVGLCLFGLDLGYLIAYRSGIKTTQLSPMAYSMIIVSVSIVGVIFYKEKLAMTKVGGLSLVVIGILITIFV